MHWQPLPLSESHGRTISLFADGSCYKGKQRPRIKASAFSVLELKMCGADDALEPGCTRLQKHQAENLLYAEIVHALGQIIGQNMGQIIGSARVSLQSRHVR